MCGHPARFQKREDMTGRTHIPVFSEVPLGYGPEGYDIENFLNKDWYSSKLLHRDIANKSGKRDATHTCKDLDSALMSNSLKLPA